MNPRAEDISNRLQAIGEEIGDLAYDTIREAISRGDTEAPAVEKQLNRARRAVEKAALLLRGGAGDDVE